MRIFRTFLPLIIFVFGCAFVPERLNFEEAQKSFPRVADVFERKEEFFKMKCRDLDISDENFSNIFIRVFKQEAMLEIWVQKQDGTYAKFKEFKVCAESGKLGPKRKQGDCQVPEGYYYINDFNPESNYHLSLGISYPNQSDVRLSPYANHGGDIYIHGGHASAGCLAMSDYYIEDIYMAAVKAKSNGQEKIPVQIFPFKPTNANLLNSSFYPELRQHYRFWKNLAEGYQLFEKTHRLPEVFVARDGYYRFSIPGSARAGE